MDSHRDDLTHAVQDAYSMRCAPQVAGAARDTLDFAARSPGGNWCPSWTIRWCCRTAGSCRPATSTARRSASPPTSSPSPPPRSARSPSAGWTGCSTCAAPATCRAFLTPDPGVNSGLMIAQYTAAGIVAENRRLASPASVDSLPTSGMQEDHVSMGWAAAVKLRQRAGQPDQPARGGTARRGARPAAARAADALARRPARRSAALAPVAGEPGPDIFLAPVLEAARAVVAGPTCAPASRPRSARSPEPASVGPGRPRRTRNAVAGGSTEVDHRAGLGRRWRCCRQCSRASWRTGRRGWRTSSDGSRSTRTPAEAPSASCTSTATRCSTPPRRCRAGCYNIVAQDYLGKVTALRRSPRRGALRARLHRVRDRRVPVLGRDPPPRAALPRRRVTSTATGSCWRTSPRPRYAFQPDDIAGSVPGLPRPAAGHRRDHDGADQRAPKARAASASATPRSASASRPTTDFAAWFSQLAERRRRRGGAPPQLRRPAADPAAAAAHRPDRLPRPGDGPHPGGRATAARLDRPAAAGARCHPGPGHDASSDAR